MDKIDWTTQGVNDRMSFSVEHHETKREAVNHMMSLRQPKTAIVRIGNHYLYKVKTT